MTNIINQYGQVKLGVRYTSAPLTSTLWGNVFGVWNADALGTSLDTSIYGVYNGDNVNDSSGNARNGTNVNNVTFTTGKVGNAFTFNGSSNYVALPNSSFDFTGDFSISTWVKIPSAPSAISAVFGNYNYLGAVEYGYAITINTSKKIRFELHGTGGSSTFVGTTILALDTWYHVTITRDSVSKTSYMYINGALEAQATNTNITIAFGANAIQPTIGALRWNDGTLQKTNYLNGQVDALTIWNKKLSDNEITSLYNVGTGAEYPFSSQLLPSPNDAVSTNHGTLMNGASFTTGKIGKAFLFDGINDIIRLPNNSLDLTGDFSISMWANWGRNNTSQILMSNFTIGASTRGWFIEHAAGQLRFRGFNSTGGNAFYIYTAYTPPLNTWVHYTFVHKNNSNKMYADGVLIGSDIGSSTHVAYDTPNYPMIGANQYNATTYQEFFQGKIDAVSVWNKELTAEEVTNLYNSGNGKQYPTT